MDYIAHIRESDGQIQSVEEHLLGVQKLAESFGEKIGVKHIAGLAGVLHDMGKYTTLFRDYIWNAVHHPELPSRRGSVDHSTAGGKLLFNEYHQGNPDMHNWMLSEIIGNAVISHHSYLHDFLGPPHVSGYLKRVESTPEQFQQSVDLFFEHVMSKEEFDQYVKKASEELAAYLQRDSSSTRENKLMFLGKYIFSSLIDADRTNTRQFEENSVPEDKLDECVRFQNYYEKLMVRIHELQENGKEHGSTIIQQLRKEMSERCEQHASAPSGIYTLSIPTGGGKTLASFRYALQHAIQKKKKRIIYIVPFTTIIEQNAEEIRRIIQDDAHLLEHHSNVIDDLDDNDESQDGYMTKQQKLKHAKDNWASPVVFTTMVQFLNVFYAKGSRNIRRLHHLAESVIIVDEVQKVPVSCVSLFNKAVNFLNVYGNSSIILCSATQPALEFVDHKLHIQAEGEIVENLEQVINAFRRVEIIDKATGEIFDQGMLEQLVLERLSEVNSVLIVLNTKSVVRELYMALSLREIPVYHLSTSMCAAHRKVILGKVKDHLIREEKVICISTQLIEAGVDISFECVIRSLAELDSIAQAAGRCNRHGRDELRQVYVINYGEENLKYLKEMSIGKEISRKMLIDLKSNPKIYGGHILSAEAMECFFKAYYTELQANLNYDVPELKKDMVELLTVDRHNNTYYKSYKNELEKELELYNLHSYRTAAKHFEVIKNRTTTVLAPYSKEGREIIAELNGAGTIEQLSRILRRAQQYSINLWRYELDELNRNDGVEALLDGKVLVLRESAYNEEFGFDRHNESPMRDAFF
ncbi:CRISPR-associated helicase Cas3' [Paenibacillus paeoniae]|uniref:CRISPR-associated helicase Cas3 n=1 Tax=Paenibacillus paeoniae TaxID=2292705 RepID=A0A371P5X7_9BACL|nr:CRISPR-associated helicase Cas3' [Paenibacillus paeoniae]REK71312.1 CRISPR-associated helicase Cas3' [Paenibacillus paeoniae]